MNIATPQQPITIFMRSKNTWDAPFTVALLIKRVNDLSLRNLKPLTQ
jgi:hypothetical protein